MFQTGVEKIKTHILCSVTLFFFDNHAVYETTYKNVLEQRRIQMTMWLMRIACWIPKAANTRSEYVLLITFPLQQWLHESAALLRYTFIAYLILYRSSFVTAHYEAR